MATRSTPALLTDAGSMALRVASGVIVTPATDTAAAELELVVGLALLLLLLPLALLPHAATSTAAAHAKASSDAIAAAPRLLVHVCPESFISL